MLTVQRTVERIYILEDDGTKHTQIVVNTPKTANSAREIPLNKPLMTMIRPLKKVVNGDYYVISNEPQPIEPRTYRNYYMKLMKRLGKPLRSPRGRAKEKVHRQNAPLTLTRRNIPLL